MAVINMTTAIISCLLFTGAPAFITAKLLNPIRLHSLYLLRPH